MKPYKTLMSLLGYLALIGMFIYIWYQWDTIPEQIPAHYNFAGEIDRYDTKTSLLIVPILTLFLFAMLTAVIHIPSMWNMPFEVTAHAQEKIKISIINMLLTMRCFITIMFTYMVSCSIRCVPLPTSFTITMIVGCAVCVLCTMLYTFRIQQKERDSE